MTDLRTDQRGLTEAQYLAQYDPNRYPRPSVTVDVALLTVTTGTEENYRKLPEKQLKVLLTRRDSHPFLGARALPGGFVGLGESLDDACERVLKEKAGVEQVYAEQLYTWGEPDRDPRMRVISCSYLALVDAERLGAPAAGWFTVHDRLLKESRSLSPDGYEHEQLVELELRGEGEKPVQARLRIIRRVSGRTARVERQVLSTQGLAFDHARIIYYALERLRGKIEWTPTAFHLLPELFTLSELQQVYELILGRELLTANFRRKIAHWVEETNHYRRDAGHRPAKLFRFLPMGSGQEL